jgi:hypothetical protein
MKKQEVLSLLERFPDLVDSDELIHDLFTEAASETAASCSTAELERKQRSDRSAAKSGDPDGAVDPRSMHRR